MLGDPVKGGHSSADFAGGPSHAMALEEPQNLGLLRELAEGLPISRQVMNSLPIAAREAAHGLNALPVGGRYELGLGPAVFAKGLDGQRLLDQRLDADLVVVGLVVAGSFLTFACSGFTPPSPQPTRKRSFRIRPPSPAQGPRSTSSTEACRAPTPNGWPTMPARRQNSAAPSRDADLAPIGSGHRLRHSPANKA
jgi:hypothetical protein